MVAQSVPIDAALAAYGRSQFGIADTLRRAQGNAFGAFGLDPNECPYQVIASGPFWRLRDYTKHDTAQSLLIVAAPIAAPVDTSLKTRISATRWLAQTPFRIPRYQRRYPLSGKDSLSPSQAKRAPTSCWRPIRRSAAFSLRASPRTIGDPQWVKMARRTSTFSHQSS